MTELQTLGSCPGATPLHLTISEGSGIFIVLALLAGIPAAIIYCLVRIGDKKPQQS